MAALTMESHTEGRFQRYTVRKEERIVYCYNPAAHFDLSFFMKRPSIHPLNTPAGMPVTEQGAHNYGHHKAVWIAHGEVNGINFYHDGPTSGRIVTRAVEWSDAPVPVLDCHIAWQGPDGAILLEERRRHGLIPGDAVHLLSVTSQFTTPKPAVELAQEKHGFFHVRVLDAIDEADGGTLLASNGAGSAAAIHDSDGLWIDCRGRVAGNPVGVTIMVHPDDGPQPLFARDYGTVALNPYLRDGQLLEYGETLRFRYAVAAYDGTPEADAIYETYLNSALAGI